MAGQPRGRYEIDMCSGPILPKMLQFALPLMCSSILQLLFNAADIVVVGRFAGDNSLAAVGSNTALINLLVNLFVGLSVGANIVAARYFGANDRKALSQTVHTSMLLGLLSGVLLAVVGALCARTVLVWMQSPPEVLDLAAVYLRIYFLGMPATMLYNFGAALLRAAGDTRRPLYYLLTAGVINVALNLLFVIQFQMDVAGVALATVISQCVSACLVIVCMVREPGGVHLDLRQLRIWPERLRPILQTGLPAGFQGILFSLSNVVIQSSINTFGETVVAGNAAAANIEAFVYTSMNAVYQADISFTSQNLGAGNLRRIRQVLAWSLVCTTAVGVVLGGLAVGLAPQLLGVYSDSAAVVAAGRARLRVTCLLYALCGMMDVVVGSLRGIGRSVMPMLVSLVGVCGLRLVWVATVFQLPAYHTTVGIYWSYPLTWAVTLAAHSLCFFWAYRRLCRQHGSPLTADVSHRS